MAETAEEYQTILQYANQSGLLVLWLGGTRSGDGSFAWTTGSPVDTVLWAAGEPNNDDGNENYLGIMFVNNTWAAYDLPGDLSPFYGSDKCGFIMEIERKQ